MRRSRLTLPPSMRTQFTARLVPPCPRPAALQVCREGPDTQWGYQEFTRIRATVWIQSHSSWSVVPEMFGQLQTLPLIVRSDALTIDLRRRVGQPFEQQAPDDLAMLQNERYFPAADLEHTS